MMNCILCNAKLEPLHHPYDLANGKEPSFLRCPFCGKTYRRVRDEP